MGEISCNIRFTWDPDAAVWVATSEDVPGLVLESDSFDDLMDRVRKAVPELLELNRKLPKLISYVYMMDRKETVAIGG